MVAGLVTANGNSRSCPTASTQREDRVQPYSQDRDYTRSHTNKTINTLEQPERDHAKTIGYYEPITMILNHIAFSAKLSARAVSALGGPSKEFSDDLFCVNVTRHEAHYELSPAKEAGRVDGCPITIPPVKATLEFILMGCN